jgi:hypothetical protein
MGNASARSVFAKTAPKTVEHLIGISQSLRSSRTRSSLAEVRNRRPDCAPITSPVEPGDLSDVNLTFSRSDGIVIAERKPVAALKSMQEWPFGL